MIKHIWSVLCESASIDNETNKVSLFNVLESLTIFGDPEQVKGVPIQFEVMSFWERLDESPSEGFIRIYQRKPSGEQIKDFKTRIDLTQSHFHRTRVKFNGMPLSGPGRYVFQIDYKEGDKKWKKAAEIPILINFAPQDKAKENS